MALSEAETPLLLTADDPAPEQPAFLQRPSERAAIAKLALASRLTASKDDGEIGPQWKLTGSPAVVMMARKLFLSHGAALQQRDSISWPAVLALFEDLLMLQHRFPIEIETSARWLWEAQYEDFLLSYALRSGAQESVGAGLFRGSYLPFQNEGVTFMVSRRKCLLADDMGLGKTVQAFGALDEIDDWPAVIVCQPHVQRHWERKLEAFMDVRRAGMLGANGWVTWMTSLNGSTPASNSPRADIYIVHYLVLHGWLRWLKEHPVKTVVFDEVQELRRDGTRKHDAAKALARAARNAFGLSGTPIYNRGIEIHTVMNTISRGVLGAKTDFIQTWCADDKQTVKNPEVLGRYLQDRGAMLRRRKEDVLADLPPKRRVVEPISADNETFVKLLAEAVRLAKDAEAQTSPFDRARMEVEALEGTRRATGIAKAPAVAAFLRGLLEAGEPTLVFAHHHAVQDVLLNALKDFNPVSITGRQTMNGKAESQDAFVQGRTNLALIGLRAATGLDGLQSRARCVVFAELDWSPAIHRQAEDRAHRFGQQDSVLVYFLVSDVGTDPHMMQVLKLKENQFTGLMQDQGETDEDRLSAEEATASHKAAILRMLRERA